MLAYAAILLNTTLHNTNAKSQNLILADEKTFIQTMLDFDKETNLSEDVIRVSLGFGFIKQTSHVRSCHTTTSHCDKLKFWSGTKAPRFGGPTAFLPPLLQSVYHGIKSKPIQLAEECSEPSIMRGWLWKLGKIKMKKKSAILLARLLLPYRVLM